LASHHQTFTNAGVRLFGVSVDSPGQQSAMVDKLSLPFPMLSDPDRSAAIDPLDLADPDDPRGLARPSLVLFAPGGQEVWRFVSRDFADRMPEDDVIAHVQAQGWPATTQDPPALGPIEPGEKAMPLDALPVYFRGARFAALAMGLRHGHLDASVTADSKAYVAEADRFIEAVQALRHR
jgi:hypothetical protein